MSTGQHRAEASEGRVAPPAGGAPVLPGLQKDNCTRKGRGKAVFVAEENIRLRPPPDAGRLKMLMPASTGSKLPTMKVADLKEVVEREPFRPFIVRLNNGAQYTFKTARNVGASMDYGMIFYFGEPRGAVRIDSDSIVEIIEGE